MKQTGQSARPHYDVPFTIRDEWEFHYTGHEYKTVLFHRSGIPCAKSFHINFIQSSNYVFILKSSLSTQGRPEACFLHLPDRFLHLNIFSLDYNDMASVSPWGLECTFYPESSDPSTELGTQNVLIMTLLLLFLLLLTWMEVVADITWGQRYTSILMSLVISRDI